MNPTLDRDFLAAEERRDRDFFRREYLAEFWESASCYLPPEMVDAAVVPARHEMLPNADAFYTAALDSAFRGDNFAFAVVSRTAEDRIIQAALRCWRGSRAKPVNLAATIEEIVSILRQFGITRIAGDQHCAERFAKRSPRRESSSFSGPRWETAPNASTRSGLSSHPANRIARRRGANSRVEESGANRDYIRLGAR